MRPVCRVALERLFLASAGFVVSLFVSSDKGRINYPHYYTRFGMNYLLEIKKSFRICAAKESFVRALR